ncbi:hypothetical protein HDU96_006024 [Phlyctochytrium bullatum]|nr:hypothetical protein HDU96_006024 [Phlyctochytrium bullatum]
MGVLGHLSLFSQQHSSHSNNHHQQQQQQQQKHPVSPATTICSTDASEWDIMATSSRTPSAASSCATSASNTWSSYSSCTFSSSSNECMAVDDVQKKPISPPPTPPMQNISSPRQQHLTVPPPPPPSAITSLPPAEIKEIYKDTHEDQQWDLSANDTNERNARIAVRWALRNCPRLDAYRIHAIVGFGSNGAVLAATPASANDVDQETPALAVKIIYRFTNPKATEPSEVRVLERIAAHGTHPNLINLCESFEDSRHFYLVTDLMGQLPSTPTGPNTPALRFWNPRLRRSQTLPISPGTCDLWSWSLAMSQRPDHPLTRTPRFTTPAVAYRLNPPPMPMCRTIFRELALAVSHLHRIGICHGDLKEENVLVDTDQLDPVAGRRRTSSPNPRPAVKLCDFGHATLDSKRFRLTAYGTREMTAPEILLNLPTQQANRPRGTHQTLSASPFASDVYALGMVLYSLLHGPGTLPLAVAQTVRHGMPLVLPTAGPWFPLGAVRSDVGAEALDLLQRMTAVDPAARLSMEEVVAHPFVRGAGAAAALAPASRVHTQHRQMVVPSQPYPSQHHPHHVMHPHPPVQQLAA